MSTASPATSFFETWFVQQAVFVFAEGYSLETEWDVLRPMSEDIRNDEALLLRVGQGPDDYTKRLETENVWLRAWEAEEREANRVLGLELDRLKSAEAERNRYAKALERIAGKGRFGCCDPLYPDTPMCSHNIARRALERKT